MRRISPCLSLTLLIALPLTATAGGLWLNEYGDPSQGRASAGAAAGTDDAAASIHSPATMTRLDSDQVMVNGGFIHSRIEFDVDSNGLANGNGDGGDSGGTIPVGGVYYAMEINDNTWFGLSLGGLAGASLDYDDDWTGRYQTTYVALSALALMPSLAYKLTDKLSLGFGLPIMYTELEMDISVPDLPGVPGGKATLDGDDLLVAVNLSTLYEFNDNTRVGVVYNSEFDANYDGGISTTGNARIDTETNLILAEIIRIGLAHNFNHLTTGFLSLGWDNWSQLGNVTISAENNGAALPRRWDDTYHYAIGVRHILNDQWRVNAGLAYDTNPVGTKDRTADLPVDRQIRYAFGAEYLLDKGPTIGAQLVYTDLGNAPIKSDGLGSGPLTGFSGDYSTNDMFHFTISANWRLGQ